MAVLNDGDDRSSTFSPLEREVIAVEEGFDVRAVRSCAGA